MKFERNELWKVIICIIIVCMGFYFLLKPKTVIATPNQENAFKVKLEDDWQSKVNHSGSYGVIYTLPKKEIVALLKKHEGIRDTVYLDTKGNPTIGIGFNLSKDGAESRIKGLGLDYDDVVNGKVSLTDKQINLLFEGDLLFAVSDASSFLPNFGKQPKEVKIVVIDMVFNMGLTRLKTFVKFRQALYDKDYTKASKEMIDSKWYHQVGNRSKELVEIIENI